MDQVFLPYEVTSILLVFSYGFISMKDFIKYNLIKTVLYFVFSLLFSAEQKIL